MFIHILNLQAGSLPSSDEKGRDSVLFSVPGRLVGLLKKSFRVSMFAGERSGLCWFAHPCVCMTHSWSVAAHFSQKCWLLCSFGNFQLLAWKCCSRFWYSDVTKRDQKYLLSFQLFTFFGSVFSLKLGRCYKESYFSYLNDVFHSINIYD